MHCRQIHVALLLGLGWMAAAATAEAATVIVRGQDTPLRGFLVAEDARGVTLRMTGRDGKPHDRFIPAAEIDIVQKPVAPERLAALRPDQPKQYRDYAEELAEKRVDPEAQQTSIRLYLIAAHLDPAALGRSSLLGMTALARSKDEQRKFRALAYLLDPQHDRKLLRSPAAARPATDAATSQASGMTKVLLRALEQLRRGQLSEANVLLRRKGVEAELVGHEDVIRYEHLLALAMDRSQRGKPASPEVAQRLLKLELSLLGAGASAGSAASTATEDDASDWSRLRVADLSARALRLSLESITEFSPRECVYRDGRWVVP